MIGWRERICDLARADARAGLRAKSNSMTGPAWEAYSNAWDRERGLMQRDGRLPQLNLFHPAQAEKSVETEPAAM